MSILFTIVIGLMPLVSGEWRAGPPANRSAFAMAKSGGTATLYDHAYYDGDSKSVSITVACTNVMDFNDRTSSVRVSDGGCIRLWQHYDCRGRSVDVQSPGVDYVAGFNDETTSVSSCEYPCYKEDVEVVIHLNGANDLAEHAENMKQIMIEWFPFIQSQLYTPAYREIRRIDLYYEDSDGVAWATPGAIHVSQQFARAIVNEPGGGMYIHEMTHVIHNPQSWGCPGWIVEGTAEYMRRWFYEPYTTPTKPTDPELDNPYIGDWLLYYLHTVMRKPIFYMITKACQEGSWTENTLKDWTGKDEKEWWREMINNDNFPWKRVR